MEDYVYLVLKKAKKPISFDSICSKVEKIMGNDEESFALNEEKKEEIKKILAKGVSNYSLYLSPNGKYILMSKTSFKKGKFYSDKNGNGRVNVISQYVDDNGEKHVTQKKYFISKENSNGAIDGDIVMIDVDSRDNNSKITKIINRHLENMVGEVYRIGSNYFLRPIDKKKQSINIALPDGGIEGQRVAVDITGQSADNFYIGKVARVFNHKDDPEEEVLWEAFKLGIDDQFSKESLEQIKKIPTKVRDIDKIGREDFTEWEIFTIDGSDTKDMDDAVSCTMLSNGNYQIGVHIADVSYYIPEDSPLDMDARRKGTSNYLVGKVIPMFPHELSNGICSLNPEVERLAMSCIMEVNPNGKLINYRITPSVIKSRIKMSYEKVNDILKRGIVDPEYEEYTETLRNLNKLALVLRKNRIKNGAIEFNRPEIKVILDDNGKVVGFSKRVQDLAENLIEEYMLLTNETIDKFIVKNGFPCLHRIHDVPNSEKLNDYLMFLSAINYSFKSGMNITGEEIAENRELMQELVAHANSSDKLSNLLTYMLIRCNSRAIYSPNNIGHYGLAKENYLHFTSPIRRYPDLTVHRDLKDVLNGDTKKINKWKEKLPEIGVWSSKMEKTEDDAEDATLRLKCAEYMGEHIGEEFNGIVTGISDRGLTIELDNLIEGFVKTRDLKGSYVYSSDSYSLVSIDGFDNYFVGDILKVKVLSTSKEDKKINFSVISKIEENKIVNSHAINNDVKIKAKNNRAKRFKNKY